MGEVANGITVVLIFIGLSSPLIVIGLFYYLKKRLEHKQILAAIEKGTPLSELRPPKPKGPLWIRNLTAGIAFLIIAAGFLCVPLIFPGVLPIQQARLDFIFAAGFFAVGATSLIRGLLQRKYPPQEPPAGQGDTGESKNPQNP